MRSGTLHIHTACSQCLRITVFNDRSLETCVMSDENIQASAANPISSMCVYAAVFRVCMQVICLSYLMPCPNRLCTPHLLAKLHFFAHMYSNVCFCDAWQNLSLPRNPVLLLSGLFTSVSPFFSQICVCIPLYAYTHARTHAHTRTGACICIYICTHIHMYMHTRTHAHSIYNT
jgi:hypothetical protein